MTPGSFLYEARLPGGLCNAWSTSARNSGAVLHAAEQFKSEYSGVVVRQRTGTGGKERRDASIMRSRSSSSTEWQIRRRSKLPALIRLSASPNERASTTSYPAWCNNMERTRIRIGSYPRESKRQACIKFSKGMNGGDCVV